jgi:hypothetical protein
MDNFDSKEFGEKHPRSAQVKIGTMRKMCAFSGAVLLGTALFSVVGSVPEAGTFAPQSTPGLAAKFPNDVGIASDPAVVFADDFESYTEPGELTSNWTDFFQRDNVRLTRVPGNIYAGKQALEFFSPKQETDLSNSSEKVLTREVSTLYLRYYSKFDTSFDVLGSSHNGSVIAAHYLINGQATPGVPANGINKFLAAFENWRGDPKEQNPGNYNLYLYHPEQRSEYGDHFFPNGEVSPNTSIPAKFAPGFVKRPNVIPDLGRWYCHEMMVKANTPGQRDGQITLWLNGQIIADFKNLRLRDVNSLMINEFSINLHIGQNTRGPTRKWYDNVVAATAYIGPLFKTP